MIAKDTIVIIPAYNEEQSIAHVLEAIPSERIIQVIVVDNNSTDNTKHMALNSNTKFPVNVIFEPQMGYGKACLTGIESALKSDPLNICFLDGDFSDNPLEMTELLDELDRGYDIVIGSRTLGKAEPKALLPQAIFGNWLATNLLYRLYGGYRFSDLGPFRIIKTQALKSLNMQDEDFGWTVEMQLKAIRQNLKCSEISVSYKQRIGVSKITGTLMGTLRAGHKILYILFKYAFKTLPSHSGAHSQNISTKKP